MLGPRLRPTNGRFPPPPPPPLVPVNPPQAHCKASPRASGRHPPPLPLPPPPCSRYPPQAHLKPGVRPEAAPPTPSLLSPAAPWFGPSPSIPPAPPLFSQSSLPVYLGRSRPSHSILIPAFESDRLRPAPSPRPSRSAGRDGPAPDRPAGAPRLRPTQYCMRQQENCSCRP
jgi:hypothetical protein